MDAISLSCRQVSHKKSVACSWAHLELVEKWHKKLISRRNANRRGAAVWFLTLKQDIILCFYQPSLLTLPSSSFFKGG